jgi:hypothetical protein
VRHEENVRHLRYNRDRVKLRLPFDAPLPDRPLARAGVLAMLAVGGLVALLVPIVFAVVLFNLLRGG